MSRRHLMAASAGATALALIAPALAAAQATPAPDGAWSFTDDRGRTVDLPARPERFVAEVAVGATLWDFGVTSTLAVFGSDIAGPDGGPSTVAGSIDFDQVQFAGHDMADLDLEMLAALQPQVILGTSWEPDDANDLGGYDESALGGLPQIAPTLAIRVVAAPVSAPLERFAELAAALGADLESPELVAARKAYDAACEAVRAATAEKPGLKVLAFYAGEDGFYVANPAVASDLMLFAELGVELVEPTDVGDDMGGFWEKLSWENVDKYHADLFLADDRAFSMSTDELMAQDSFKFLPAAQAGQIGPWSVEYVISYQGLTAVLEALAESVRNAQVLTS
jgi:iron complex transport system substrate-binding protein